MKHDRLPPVATTTSVDALRSCAALRHVNEALRKRKGTHVILASRIKFSLIAAVTHKCAYASLPQYSSTLHTTRQRQRRLARTSESPFCKLDDGRAFPEPQREHRVPSVVPIDDDLASTKIGGDLDDEESRNCGWILQHSTKRQQFVTAFDPTRFAMHERNETTNLHEDEFRSNLNLPHQHPE